MTFLLLLLLVGAKEHGLWPGCGDSILGSPWQQLLTQGKGPNLFAPIPPLWKVEMMMMVVVAVVVVAHPSWGCCRVQVSSYM